MDYDPMDQNTCTSYQCCPSFSRWAPFAADFSSAITGKCKSLFTFFTLTLFAFTLSLHTLLFHALLLHALNALRLHPRNLLTAAILFSGKLTKVMAPQFQFSEHDIAYLNTRCH
ncbi:hypothetical protein C361_06910 [Cryptococcus neoformans Tu259-1]|uniref:Uncharacterized protein n=1 Tax=Cryptococcus neoformans Tu259-1 TaxID=1230072 RepID=A0A854Q3W7_CRYNE|nr:hypothetical protein C361_06910 [Cryptococcus neoformans var. grubii Tu259-1]